MSLFFQQFYKLNFYLDYGNQQEKIRKDAEEAEMLTAIQVKGIKIFHIIFGHLNHLDMDPPENAREFKKSQQGIYKQHF